jgi:peptidoglycan hydrolase-like protein with peptidoglycan-binding domain
VAALEDSFINGAIGLVQIANYGLGNALDMPHLISQGDSLGSLKSPLERLGGYYSPGSTDQHIGESVAAAIGAYAIAEQIPNLLSRIGNWWNSVGTQPTPIFAPDTPAQFTQTDVEAAIARLEARGIQTTEVQSSIDPNQVIRIGQSMQSGAFQNALMDSPVIIDSTTQTILAGNHRIIAAEMTGFNLSVNSIPVSVSSIPLSRVPLQTGRVNPPIRKP